MWVFSVTTATSAIANFSHRTASGSSYESAQSSTAGSVRLEQTSFSTSGETEAHAWGATTRETVAFTQRTEDSVTEEITGLTLLEIAHGFSVSETHATTESPDGTTTDSSQETAARTLDSYLSTTTTTTAARNVAATTTQTTTRTLVTASAQGSTSTTASLTRITATTVVSTITTTTYGTAASTTLAAPLALVRVSVAEVTEQAWEITAAAVTVGYPSDLGGAFTRRTGTRGSSSSALPVSASHSFTTTVESPVTVTLTWTTTSHLTVTDTFVPNLSVLPATATDTRTFLLLTTSTLTTTGATWATVPHTVVGLASRYNPNPVTFLTERTALLEVTINLSPTATTTAQFHFAWPDTTTRFWQRGAASHAISQAATVEGGDSTATLLEGTVSTDTTTSATATVTSTSTSTQAATSTGTDFAASQFATDTCQVPPSTETDSSSGEVMPGLTTVESYYTFHDAAVVTISETVNSTVTEFVSSTVFGPLACTEAPGEETGSSTFFDVGTETTYIRYQTTSHQVFFNVHYISEEVSRVYTTVSVTATHTTYSGTHTRKTESYVWSTYATLDTITVTYTATITNTGTATTSTDATITTTADSGSSFSEIEGISVTWQLQRSQLSQAVPIAWTAHAMHPRPGWRAPLNLASDGSIYSALSISPASTIYYPFFATQDDADGPRALPLWTEQLTYRTGASAWTARFETSNSRLYWSSAVTETYTTTQRNGTITATLTRISTSATASGSASFSGASSVQWYHPQSTTQFDGSAIGGMSPRVEYGAALYSPPGLRHWTHQSGGTISASLTEWLATPDIAATSTEGYALPLHRETALSLVLLERSPVVTVFEVGEVEPLGSYLPIFVPSSTFDVLPAVTCSLNPDL